MSEPLVTVGFVNCNRLHYLKSCVESFLECTADYTNKELIIIDNASVEAGTIDYLNQKESQGVKVVRRERRDPSNEFAQGLNTIVSESNGDFVIPLQGDMQFVVRGKWLKHYVDFYLRHDDVGCITLDAQRQTTIDTTRFEKIDESFLALPKTDCIRAAGDVMFSRSILKTVGPWSEKNANHEGTADSETDMLERCRKMCLPVRIVSPIIPVAVAIYTDARGTNARVRGNRRYGDYWPPVDGVQYYEISDHSDMCYAADGRSTPMSIESIARPIGFNAPIDVNGSWMKNPIKPELALPSEYVEL